MGSSFYNVTRAFSPCAARQHGLKARVTLVLLSLLLMMLVGCDQTPANAPLKELRLGYFANATHAQAVLGVDSGDFAKAIAPVELKTRIFNAGPSLIEALFAGEIDIGYIGPGPALSAHEKSKGQGVRIIAGAAANGVVIVARKDSGIKELKDLVGKKVATPQHGNTQDIAARHYLTKVLGQADHTNVIPVANAEQAGLMSRGQIDAAWAPEPWGARLVAEADATIIAEEKDLWPEKQFSLTVVITTPEFLTAHPEIARKMLVVHREWTKKLNADPSGILPQLEEALFKLTTKKLPPGVMPAAFPRVTFTDQPLEETFRTMGQWSYDLKFGQQPPKLDNLFDLTILNDLSKSPPN